MAPPITNKEDTEKGVGMQAHLPSEKVESADKRRGKKKEKFSSLSCLSVSDPEVSWRMEGKALIVAAWSSPQSSQGKVRACSGSCCSTVASHWQCVHWHTHAQAVCQWCFKLVLGGPPPPPISSVPVCSVRKLKLGTSQVPSPTMGHGRAHVPLHRRTSESRRSATWHWQ
jgi:hypothetical protein